jgi:isocitrate dehydrogenase kinase/phosphatase
MSKQLKTPGAETAIPALTSTLNGGQEAAQAGVIDQVRELLFGETRRSTEQQLADLDAKLEAKVQALRADMMDRVAELERRIVDLDHASDSQRLASIDDIGVAISELGNTIRKLGASRKGS